MLARAETGIAGARSRRSEAYSSPRRQASGRLLLAAAQQNTAGMIASPGQNLALIEFLVYSYVLYKTWELSVPIMH
jgi:hypothetical protein